MGLHVKLFPKELKGCRTPARQCYMILETERDWKQTKGYGKVAGQSERPKIPNYSKACTDREQSCPYFEDQTVLEVGTC